MSWYDGPNTPLVATAVYFVFAATAYLWWSNRAAPKSSSSSAVDHASLREQRLRKLAGETPVEGWENGFFSNGVPQALKMARANKQPLMICVESDSDDRRDIASLKLRQQCWPSPRVQSLFDRESDNSIVALRFHSSSSDGSFFLSVFGQPKSHVPILVFLQNGKARLARRANFTADQFLHFVETLRAEGEQELQNDGEEANKRAQHKLAEDLLNAYGNAQVARLLKNGTVNMGDIVMEGNEHQTEVPTDNSFGSYSVDEDTAVQELLLAQRHTVRGEQEQQYRESLAADRARKEKRQKEEAEQERRRLQQEQEEEDAVDAAAAKEAWKAALLSEVPAEPGIEERKQNGVIRLTIIMRSSGRKLTRFWRQGMKLTSLFHFVEGSATDEEEQGEDGGSFFLVQSFPRLEIKRCKEATLEEAGLHEHTVLHVKSL